MMDNLIWVIGSMFWTMFKHKCVTEMQYYSDYFETVLIILDIVKYK